MTSLPPPAISMSLGSKEEMKMKKQIISIASIVLGGIILLAGCQKDGTTSKAGSLVKFTAGLKPAATRTAYSGVVTNNFERINWEEGDEIVIWSDEAVDRNNTDANYASYAISSPQASGVKSTASLNSLTDGNGLIWVEGVETYKFWGSSPAISGTPVNGKASFTIPAAQQMKSGATAATATEGAGEDAVTTVTLPADMSNAWMFACVEGAQSGKNVQLDFYPAFTAFELTFEGDADYDGKITVTKVDLISDSPLAGSVEATLAPGTRTNTVGEVAHTIGASTYACTAAGESPYTLSYTLPEGSVVSAKDRIVLTVFALPQDVAGLKLRFHVTIDGEETTFTGTLSKGGQPITFGACEKHRIKGVAVPGNLWKIFYAPGIIEADEWVEVDGDPIIVE